MTVRDYLLSLKGKTAAVLGIGVSNTPLIALLCENGIRTIACDRKSREALGACAAELASMGAELRLGEGYLDDLDADVIFRTPGMRSDVPALAAAREKGSVITSEMEAFFEVCPCTIIGVTGSDGKTTTASIIAEILRAAGKTVWLGGNIGHPLLCDAAKMKESDLVVVELSSFQLLDMKRSPHIAVVTNLAPNHLDWHTDMAEYVAAKKNIFLHQGKNDILVLNADNEASAPFLKEAKGEVRLFSRRTRTENGAFLDAGTVFVSCGGAYTPIVEENHIRLPGQHNIENYMAAFSAVRDFVGAGVMEQTARSFAGVEHRIELVRELRGVKWYNDSIASSPTRTIAGLRAFEEKVILIAGGYDKHIPFTPLAPEIISHAKLLILCGATADAIEQAVRSCADYCGSPEILRCASLKECVETANARAKSGDVVTLSPACAAFDQFRDFMERGKVFKELVNAL
ncbi:MAG: UDP-N-acetylmuramoyl-L-alanine--D-glutamate ligase [Oscillospiraceae bacterium]|nr:UDP-N-acetylmuramoyl-L-alanine--D-glutamate ligase [Oscillospiraceae bacterium]MDY5735919.1 UDP-N-acetylmuramoyl-L-alanine--D-glutamate ligase [Oscillospiraceae bacterium]